MSDPNRRLSRYRVMHGYRSGRWHLIAGSDVDLLPADAAWLLRDSPGVLERLDGPQRASAEFTATWSVEGPEG